MAANRKQPFGYRMEFGEITLHQAEAETVRWIYQAYLKGASYNTLVEALRERGVPYIGEKLWNKNMVARILGNTKYIGESGYPPLIPKEQYDAVRVRRQDRVSVDQKPPAQKALRRLCGGSPSGYVEREVLKILNRLIRQPTDIACVRKEKDDPAETKKLLGALDEALHDPPVDEEQTRTLIFQLAALRLNAIGPEEYETIRLQRLFQGRAPLTELDEELLNSSIKRITYAGKAVTVLLKNNQAVKGGNAR